MSTDRRRTPGHLRIDDLWNSAAACRVGSKCRRRCGADRRGPLVAVTGNRRFLQYVESPDIIQAHDVIRMAVRVNDRVDPPHVVGKGLRSQIRRRIDENDEPSVGRE